ncbi:MAG: HAD-IIIA family hydrolase, partial [Tumebacillaceae bacterium]
VRYCPHLQGCSCRKPQPGMLLDLASRHAIDLSRSVMIGDKHTDVQAGLNACCHSLMIGTPGNGDLLSIAKRLQSEEVLS